MNNPSPVKLSSELIDRLVPATDRSVEDIEASYPERQLPEGAEVTRIAPSPTGFMHIGVLYMSLICQRIAQGSDGVFFLRIEDTDKKREIEGATDLILKSLDYYNISRDEGYQLDCEDDGMYGPYLQSERAEIYQTYIRHLLETGLAYPCFMTPNELSSLSEEQRQQKVRPGYYGQWAKWRDRSEEEIIEALDSGKTFVIRFRSPGDESRRITFEDRIKGKIEMPENTNDLVIMKQDGLPTYHLAHAIDDSLMRTTLVIRGDEWLSSVPTHIQLSEALGHKPFSYAHVAPLEKTENSSRRKLSKRKDPEASMSYYMEEGYLPDTVVEYLLNQANSAFEAWREENPDLHHTSYKLSLDNFSKSGALFSFDKLNSIGADQLALLTVDEFYNHLVDWSKEFNTDFHQLITKHEDYTKAIISIERDGDQPRKDLSRFSEAPDQYGYFYDEVFDSIEIDEDLQVKLDRIAKEDQQAIIEKFLAGYDPADDNETWFGKVKALGEELGFTPKQKLLKKHPELYKGSVADVAMIIRVALTKRNRTPNLHEIMRVMGTERIEARLKKFAS